MIIFLEPTIKLVTGIFDLQSNNNSFHDGTGVFFSMFFSKKTRTIMSLRTIYNIIPWGFDNWSCSMPCFVGGAVAKWLSLLQNFIQQILNSTSAQLLIPLAVFWKITRVKGSKNVPGWKKRWAFFLDQIIRKRQFIINIITQVE